MNRCLHSCYFCICNIYPHTIREYLQESYPAQKNQFDNTVLSSSMLILKPILIYIFFIMLVEWTWILSTDNELHCFFRALYGCVYDTHPKIGHACWYDSFVNATKQKDNSLIGLNFALPLCCLLTFCRKTSCLFCNTSLHTKHQDPKTSGAIVDLTSQFRTVSILTLLAIKVGSTRVGRKL
jgi:hypothetical protein